jgi:hypothetical protein
MKTLKVVVGSLFILQVWMVAGVCAGPVLPSPVKQRIVVHGAYTDGCDSTIDADGAVVLDEAATLLQGPLAGAVVVVDGLQSRCDSPRPQRGAEPASVYLTQHGVDPANIRVGATGGMPPVALCELLVPMCPLSGSC